MGVASKSDDGRVTVPFTMEKSDQEYSPYARRAWKVETESSILSMTYEFLGAVFCPVLPVRRHSILNGGRRPGFWRVKNTAQVPANGERVPFTVTGEASAAVIDAKYVHDSRPFAWIEYLNGNPGFSRLVDVDLGFRARLLRRIWSELLCLWGLPCNQTSRLRLALDQAEVPDITTLLSSTASSTPPYVQVSLSSRKRDLRPDHKERDMLPLPATSEK
jgi:hypothetical protein